MAEYQKHHGAITKEQFAAACGKACNQLEVIELLGTYRKKVHQLEKEFSIQAPWSQRGFDYDAIFTMRQEKGTVITAEHFGCTTQTVRNVTKAKRQEYGIEPPPKRRLDWEAVSAMYKEKGSAATAKHFNCSQGGVVSIARKFKKAGA
jgi:hypothetical protein